MEKPGISCFTISIQYHFIFEIRGKLGKNAAGWLTMEDVDRKKVFVEKTKPPPKVITSIVSKMSLILS